MLMFILSYRVLRFHAAPSLPRPPPTTTQGFENMDETFLRNVSRLGSRFRGTELGGAHTGLAGEDEEEEVSELEKLSRLRRAAAVVSLSCVAEGVIGFGAGGNRDAVLLIELRKY